MDLKCSNCGSNADHMHHVVPKSKGGTFTVPLCHKCHSHVHQFKIAGSYLTRIGLIKAQKELLCRVFFLCAAYQYTAKEIQTDLNDEFGEQFKEVTIKRYIKRMQAIDTKDLMCIFDEILQTKDNKVFTHEAFIEDWEYYCNN